MNSIRKLKEWIVDILLAEHLRKAHPQRCRVPSAIKRGSVLLLAYFLFPDLAGMVNRSLGFRRRSERTVYPPIVFHVPSRPRPRWHPRVDDFEGHHYPTQGWD